MNERTNDGRNKKKERNRIARSSEKIYARKHVEIFSLLLLLNKIVKNFKICQTLFYMPGHCVNMPDLWILAYKYATWQSWKERWRLFPPLTIFTSNVIFLFFSYRGKRKSSFGLSAQQERRKENKMILRIIFVLWCCFTNWTEVTSVSD